MEPISREEESEARRAMAWLLWGDPLRKAADGVLIGVEPRLPPDELTGMLSSRKGWWRRRWLAAWLLGHATLNPTQREDAIRTLMPLAGPQPANPTGCLAAAGCVTIPLALPPMLLWFSALVTAVRSRRANAVRAAMVDTLGRLDAREAIATLLMITQQNPRVYPSGGRKDLRDALTRALPRVLALVGASDYGRLPGPVTPQLAAVARHAPEPVAIAALGALERAGDGRAVEIVGRLASRRTRSAVRDAAARALAALLPRKERERQASVLLRPAMSPEAPSQILLRPAGGAPPADQPLLRAAMPPETAPGETAMQAQDVPESPAWSAVTDESEVVWLLPRDA